MTRNLCAKVFCTVSLLLTPAFSAELSLNKGDHICLVGNELGERMQHHNFWETLLHQRFPEKQLVVRNLCFPGDEPFERIRSQDFGHPDEHLAHSKASVILYFFGFNESFAGEQGLDAFRADMTRLVEETKKKDYSGQGPPRIVLISPVAFEDTGDHNLPDAEQRNEQLRAFADVLPDVARQTGVGFVDLFSPTLELFESTEERLTLNGAHLNEAGYRALAPALQTGLFGSAGDGTIDPAVKAEVDDKNFHWWHRYRAVNGYSIYGARGLAGSDGTYNNRDVMERERAILDQMTANRDQRIWARARGEAVAQRVDDSNTLPFINPKTNVGGDDDPNRKRGKLGSLNYLSAGEQQKLFKLAPGYEIQLVASEEQFPELANPVALNFDNQGRLWVATMPSYPHWKPKTQLDDRLLILEDHDLDGRVDVCKVFAGGLHQPTGFELGHGGAFVAQQPDILYLRDTDGDDRADHRVRKLVGFDSADSHHGLAAFEWGPGGGLYFQEGTFKFSQVESPYGLTRLHEAGVWRYEPRTEKFGVHVSLAFSNPWGHVFDRWGQNFIADASPGYSYWAAPISGHIAYPFKHPGGSQHKRIAHQTGGDPRFLFPTFYPKRMRPSAGCELVASRHFPPDIQGNFLLTNCIGERAVLNHRVSEEGSGFVGEEVTPLVFCDDGNFRPVDLQFAPDGSLYIVDWHNALIGHLQHNLREPHRDHSHGRIWRVTYRGRPLVEPARVAGQPIAELLDLLGVYEDRTRYRARRELAERDTAEVIPELKIWVARLDADDEQYEHHLLEALWVHQTHNAVDLGLLEQLLEARDHRARAAATRVLCFWRDELSQQSAWLEALRMRLRDPHPRVRLEAVRALSFVLPGQKTKALEFALEVLNHPMDEYLQYTLNETLRVLDPAARPSATDLAHDHQHHDHDAAEHQQATPTDSPASQLPPPLVFLDKSPRVVQYQLQRLDNERLLQVPRSADSARFAPVYTAILTRAGMSPQYREEALAALVELNDSDSATELLRALQSLEEDNRQQGRTRDQLAGMLLKQPTSELREKVDALREIASDEDSQIRAVGYAALITAGNNDLAWSQATVSQDATLDWLAAVSLLPQAEMRAEMRPAIVGLLGPSQANEIRRGAIRALAAVPAQQAETFQLVAPLVSHPQLRSAAVQTLLQLPSESRNAEASDQLAESLVHYAEQTPPAERTTDQFIDAMQLADQLLARLPVERARTYRSQFRELTVRVVRIKTVEEEMRYDTAYFAVEAGRPVQIVLQNEDLMPHNLVVTQPGALREVAEEGRLLGPQPGFEGKPYVPRSRDVLFATDMVPAGRQERLTFTAPSEPGEYPYVCTFPRHWMRMYGVMIVVKDLDAWLQDPTVPTDPIGSTRSFVQSWTVEDFVADLDTGLRGRSAEIGQKIFAEATCAQCHKVGGQGGAVGPELAGVFDRWKGDRAAVLREILDPSHRIDSKYAVQIIVTADGNVVTGIVTDEDDASVSVVANPEAPEPTVIARPDIDEQIMTSKSMMPKALLDRFTRDEVLELLAYLQTANPK